MGEVEYLEEGLDGSIGRVVRRDLVLELVLQDGGALVNSIR